MRRNNVSEFEWRKRARKKMYPSELLWVHNGKVTTSCYWTKSGTEYLRARVGWGPRPLPLKLYKFYLNKNIEYTHFKNIDDKVYEMYDEIPEHEYNIGSITV